MTKPPIRPQLLTDSDRLRRRARRERGTWMTEGYGRIPGPLWANDRSAGIHKTVKFQVRYPPATQTPSHICRPTPRVPG